MRNGKLRIPVLAVRGAISNTGPRMEAMMREVADHLNIRPVPATALWIREENPKGFVDALLAFMEENLRPM